MKKIDNIAILEDELIRYSIQLDSINELITINLGNSDISKSKEQDRLYFLNDYIKDISEQLYNLCSKLTGGDD
ncbi:hypothetical protein CP360_04470 [Lactobacillus sp. UMNPBX9]|uniref:hypothetical protein n=1 Tax=Ligilactobacillus salivarius TaxID=1624 RepID=UPI000BEEA481|nr:hypothetical protein [Ligilactobacillus salivarius]MDF4189960.1 hypothetical protein [Ligilactobacillus salivarius]PEG96862.1 hypothetical protein CP360_04470 [Lactobacillus sp. UMNPBX9]